MNEALIKNAIRNLVDKIKDNEAQKQLFLDILSSCWADYEELKEFFIDDFIEIQDFLDDLEFSEAEAVAEQLIQNEDLTVLFSIEKRKLERNSERVEILTEEPSMESLLRIILPKILPEGYELDKNCFVRPHQGKTDLQKSIPKKVRAYQNFSQPIKLVVIQDQDSNDCLQLKQTLIDLIQNENPNQAHLIRIACKELENWYLGDLPAIRQVYNFRGSISRNVDDVFGADYLENRIKGFQKGFAAREIPKYMDIDRNVSTSFNQFLTGMRRFLQ